MKFNINNTVKIKLTQHGLKIMEENYSQHQQFKNGVPFLPPPIDENGYTTMQLWYVMHMFGSRICSLCKLSFETDIILFDGDLKS